MSNIRQIKCYKLYCETLCFIIDYVSETSETL